METMKKVREVEMLKAIIIALGFGSFGGNAWDGLDSLTLSEFREAKDEVKSDALTFFNDSAVFDSLGFLLEVEDIRECGDEVRDVISEFADSWFYQANIGIIKSKDRVLKLWEVLVAVVVEGWGCKFGDVVKYDDFGDLDWEHWADVIDLSLFIDSLCVLSSYLVEHGQLIQLAKCQSIEEIINLLYD